MTLEVADHAVHAQARILLGQLGRAFAHHALGHIDRDVARSVPACSSASSSTRVLVAVPEPSSTSSAASVSAASSARVALEDRTLGAGRVVLGQLADPVEQLGAAGVVEVLGRQFLERTRETVEHIVGERSVALAVEMGVDADRRLDSGLRWGVRSHQQVPGGRTLSQIICPPVTRRAQSLSLGPCARSSAGVSASRTPAKICLRWGRSQLRKCGLCDALVGRPRAAAQHAVILAEEDLRVLAIGVRDEARVAVEATARPLPGAPERLRAPSMYTVAAFSHSASLGRRASWALAYASASNQLMWQAIASGCPSAADGSEAPDCLKARPNPRETTTRAARSRRLREAEHSGVAHGAARDRERAPPASWRGRSLS